jgi:hypothetical protein
VEPSVDGDANNLYGKLVADEVNLMPSVPLSLHEPPQRELAEVVGIYGMMFVDIPGDALGVRLPGGAGHP